MLPIYMIVYGELTAMFGDRIDFPERTSTQIQLLPLFGGGTILLVFRYCYLLKLSLRSDGSYVCHMIL